MTENLKNDKFENWTHEYHDKYRTSGIALCISLATLASAESWWFYGLFIKDIKNTCNCTQIYLWYTVIISAIIIILSSFVYQFLHYHGTKHQARSFFHRHILNHNQGDAEESKVNLKSEWKSFQKFFKAADFVITWPLTVSTIINLFAAIIYIVKYEPNPIIK